MRIIQRIAAVGLSLLMLMANAARAEIPFLVFSKDWNWNDTPVEVLLKANIDTHMPFDNDRLSMLTPITDMLSMRLVAGKDQGSVTIAFEEQDILSIQYKGNEAQLSSMPDTTYTAATEPLDMLLGGDVSVDSGYELLHLDHRGETLLIDGKKLLERIPFAFEAYGKRTKTDTNISGYGQSAYRYDYTISAAKADAIQGILLSICTDGWLKDIISTLTFSGKQSLRMYYTADDMLVRAEYNGSCGLAGDLRTVKLVIRARQDAEVEKDYWELTSPAVKGKNKNNLTFERTVQTNKQGNRCVAGNFNYTVVKDGVPSVRKAEFDLINAFTDTSDVISGSIKFQNKLDGAEKYTAVTLEPELAITGDGSAPIINGTLAVTEEYAGRTTEHAVISILLQASEGIEWEDRERLVNLAALNEDELAAIHQQVASSIATAIVHPIIVMMGEEAEWFFRELPEEATQKIIETAEMPVY